MENTMINEAMEKAIEENVAEKALVNEAMTAMTANETPVVPEVKSSGKAKWIWLGIGIAAVVLRKPIARGIQAVVGLFTGDNKEEKMHEIAKEELAKMLANGGVPQPVNAEEIKDPNESTLDNEEK